MRAILLIFALLLFALLLTVSAYVAPLPFEQLERDKVPDTFWRQKPMHTTALMSGAIPTASTQKTSHGKIYSGKKFDAGKGFWSGKRDRRFVC